MAKVKKSIIFCHGIWADGSCFNKVIPTLQAEGYKVMSAQYALDTNEVTLPRQNACWGALAARDSRRPLLRRIRHHAAGTDDRVAGWSISPHSLRTPVRPRRVR